MFGRLKLGMLIVGCDWAVVVDAAAGTAVVPADAVAPAGAVAGFAAAGLAAAGLAAGFATLF